MADNAWRFENGALIRFTGSTKHIRFVGIRDVPCPTCGKLRDVDVTDDVLTFACSHCGRTTKQDIPDRLMVTLDDTGPGQLVCNPPKDGD